MADLISRQAAIDALHTWFRDGFDKDRWWNSTHVLAAIEGLPSAQPEQKTGKWIPVTNGRGGHECDQCHEYAPSWQTGEERLTDYCPKCGAMMEDKE